MKIKMASWLVFFIFTFIAFSVWAQPQKTNKPVKKGILLVAFGSTVPEAQAAYINIDKKVKSAFPDITVRWAYTSHIIRNKLAKEGKQLDSVEFALAKLMDEGFTHVAVQSLHVIPGEEFHDLIQNVKAFETMKDGIQKLAIGTPLIGSGEDVKRIIDTIFKIIPKERQSHEAVVFMGHGTAHASNAVYAAMMYYFQKQDPNIFIGTVEKDPLIEDIKKMLIERNISKAYLLPFMTVAGDHARKDLTGDQSDSWKSILTKAGITCTPILKGMAEYDEMVEIWIDHLKNAYSQFEAK